MTDMKFNFRSTLGFVTDGVGETFFGGGAYSGGVGYGITTGPDNYADRDNALDRRLAGILYMTHGFGDLEFRADIGNGTFDMRCAMGDVGPHTDSRLRFYDGANATPILTIGPTATTGWVDAAGTDHATAAAWVASNASAPITITGGYVRVILGNSTGDYTALSHLSFVASGGGGGGGSASIQRGIARGVARGVGRGIRRVMETFDRRPSGLWMPPSLVGVR